MAQDIIVTNDHVLNDECEITYYKNGIKHSAIPVFTSEQNDIAILKGDPIDEPYFKLLSSTEYSVATPIFRIGVSFDRYPWKRNKSYKWHHQFNDWFGRRYKHDSDFSSYSTRK